MPVLTTELQKQNIKHLSLCQAHFSKNFRLTFILNNVKNNSINKDFIMKPTVSRYDRFLNIIYKSYHKDYKGMWNGERSIMILRKGSTTLVPLSQLTDNEISAKLNQLDRESFNTWYRGERPE
jgi:hypothetical protein